MSLEVERKGSIHPEHPLTHTHTLSLAFSLMLSGSWCLVSWWSHLVIDSGETVQQGQLMGMLLTCLLPRPDMQCWRTRLLFRTSVPGISCVGSKILILLVVGGAEWGRTLPEPCPLSGGSLLAAAPFTHVHLQPCACVSHREKAETLGPIEPWGQYLSVE